MSAWIVDKAVIDLLVEAAFRYEVPVKVPLTPDALGALLWKENHRSVNYRYHTRCQVPHYTHESSRVAYEDWPDTSLDTIATLARTPLMVLEQLACYEYQTCEHPTWARSRAYRTIQALKVALLAPLATTYAAAMEAAAAAPWGIVYASHRKGS